MNIHVIFLQPHRGNSFDDDWEMEWEDIVEGNGVFLQGRKLWEIGESLRARRNKEQWEEEDGKFGF